MEMELFILIIKFVVVIISAILLLRKKILCKRRSLKGKNLYFKTIRKEYIEDTINGCFAIQQYFNRYLREDEIDYILKSPNAYKIFSLLKAAWGKYEFKDNKFVPNVKGYNYILPGIGYFISWVLLTIQIMCLDKIMSAITNQCYSWVIIIIFSLCVSIPLLITCSMSISGINCARRLAEVTNEEKKNDTKSKCLFSCSKNFPFFKCKNAEEKNTEEITEPQK